VGKIIAMVDKNFRVSETNGHEMYSWCKELFPINRSLTGNGVRETLSYLKDLLPELRIIEVPSGTKCFDWEIPYEWNISDAWIRDSSGNTLVNFLENNLHVMGYSTPQDMTVSREELDKHLHSIPSQPDAIPYVTSYYSQNWGFCLPDQTRKSMSDQLYTVYIDSSLKPGSMTYGELFIKGETTDEILLTTYVCHPSMANNELSGPAVLTRIAQCLAQASGLKFSYRILFLVETIGSIYYISKNLEILQKNVKAGFVLTCMGDDRMYSYVPTRDGNCLTDRVAKEALRSLDVESKMYSWLDRGSDERQFNSPGVDLPIGSLMRSKYGDYPEYHTSLDDLSVISPSGLLGGFNLIWRALEILEKNDYYKVKTLGEPQMGKRGLYPNTSGGDTYQKVKNQMDVISYLDGKRDLMEIAEICSIDFDEVWKIVCRMLDVDLVELLDS